MGGLPLPFPLICIQCGTDQNPMHCKIVGPTIGFVVTVVCAVVCWPGALLCGCCATEAGKKTLSFPADTGNAVNNAIPI